MDPQFELASGPPLAGKIISEPVNKFVDGKVPTLADCEQHIAAVTHQWLLGVGRALKAIRDHKLYEETGYTSFESYVSHRWEWTRQRAHQLITSLPIVEIVAPHADREIKEGQTRVLSPVYDRHGAGAVLEVWHTASRSGKPTAATLERIARAKGFLDEPDQTASESTPAQFASAPVLIAMRAALKGFDLRTVRQVALETPEAAQGILRDCEEVGNALLAIAAELKADLPTDES
ncbi:hypothetical protein [Streptosporangium subroseum]|uniref:hypothetical protein n=1 Tax=Streptosporangium subroseum TaxID=106412 RepID=UPI000B77DD70|nr:hypothetical protein [Streptosporangium subroseum]